MGLESQQVGDRGGAGSGWPGGKEDEGEGERVPPTRKTAGSGSSWCLPQTLDQKDVLRQGQPPPWKSLGGHNPRQGHRAPGMLCFFAQL